MVRFLPTLLLTSLCAGCMPAISHSPRVEPGPSFGATASAPLGPRYTQGEAGDLPFLFGPVGLAVGYGVATAAPGEPAYRVGLHVPALAIPGPLFILASHLDVYAQAPELWLREWDFGAGINGSLGHAMPYLQFGRMGTSNTGWYTTQGVYFRLGGIDLLDAVLWMPEIAYQWRTKGLTYRAFASGGIGKQYGRCSPYCDRTAPHRQALAVGVALEVHRRPREASSR